jgi:hypothetical protein
MAIVHGRVTVGAGRMRRGATGLAAVAVAEKRSAAGRAAVSEGRRTSATISVAAAVTRRTATAVAVVAVGEAVENLVVMGTDLMVLGTMAVMVLNTSVLSPVGSGRIVKPPALLTATAGPRIDVMDTTTGGSRSAAWTGAILRKVTYPGDRLAGLRIATSEAAVTVTTTSAGTRGDVLWTIVEGEVVILTRSGTCGLTAATCRFRRERPLATTVGAGRGAAMRKRR